MKTRSPIRRASEKRLAANGGKMFSTITQKPTKVKKVNRKRRKSEFARTYHSKQRVEFVKSLPCCACGYVGLSENAHMATGGTGRKADYTSIAPLCGRRNGFTIDKERDPYIGYIGCHASLHWVGLEAFHNRFPAFDPQRAAADTEKLWLEYSNNGATK